MAINIEQLASQIYAQTISPDILSRVAQGANLDKLYKGAAAQSIAAAGAFARAYEEQRTLSAAPVA